VTEPGRVAIPEHPRERQHEVVDEPCTETADGRAGRRGQGRVEHGRIGLEHTQRQRDEHHVERCLARGGEHAWPGARPLDARDDLAEPDVDAVGQRCEQRAEPAARHGTRCAAVGV
jgi:hypothetical protein